MGQLSLWPDVVDSDGTPGNGTPANKALLDAIRDAILDEVYDPTNPTLKISQVLAEIVAARGSKTTIDERLDISLNEDGSLKTIAGVVNSTTLASQLAANYVANGDFLIWPDGDAAAPSYMVLDSGAVARIVVTPTPKIGANCARVSGTGQLSHYVAPAGSISGLLSWLAGLTVGYGCWLYGDTADIGQLVLDDGITVSQATDALSGVATLHEVGSWRWFSLTHTINPSATKLQLKMKTINTGNVYFSGLTLSRGNQAPSGYLVPPTTYDDIPFHYAGTLPLSQAWAGPRTRLGSRLMSRPAFVKDVQLMVDSAPATTAIKCDVGVNDTGGTINSMFSGSGAAPTIVAAALAGAAQPDGTYSRRCLRGKFGTAVLNGSRLYAEIAQTDGATPGTELDLVARVITPRRILEPFLLYND